MPIQYIYSHRKTIGLEVKPDGQVIVRAPYRMSKSEVDAFVEKHRDWIEKHLEKVQKVQQEAQKDMLTMDEIQNLAQEALKYIPPRVAYYAKQIGVTYGRITIRNQRTRWGSCSSKGNLNFNCLLMLMPKEVIDSVIVHELCHRKEMNHSPKFYAEVRKAYPEYDKWNKWLKENGAAIMQRMP